jgi:hypothetical protein
MIVNALIEEIENYLKPLLNESGSIVFSSVDTIKKGDLYTLGLNPGGETFIPINKTLSELPHKKHNSYLDEIWGNRRNPAYIKGQHPLQRNYTGLIRAIGYNPSDIFSSNLIFTRSRGQYTAQFSTRVDTCWNVHKEFIKIVDPKCFIVFGNSKISPYQYIKNKYPLKNEDSLESGHGGWKCHSCSGVIEGKERILIGVPHLSRYYITHHENVIYWIKSKI